MSELRLPELGENIETVEISAVLVAIGDRIRRDQPVIEVETEKASLEVPATADGRVVELRVKRGDRLTVGEVILVVESGADADAVPEKAPLSAEPRKPVSDPAPAVVDAAAVLEFPARPRREASVLAETVPAAPSVRALARELGIEIREVPGTGPTGRISRADVKAHAKRLIRGRAVPTGPGPAAPPLPDFSGWGAVRREPLSNVRRATASSMARSWTAIPHVTQFDRADITELEAMRRRFNQRPEAAGHKLTVTAMALKLAATALKQFPQFNASLDAERGEVVYKQYINIGVAVDTDRGLLVPVVRDVERKRLLQVAAEITDLAQRARGKKVKPDELAGASFTVTNLGGLGTTYFSPIINWPEVAILGIGRAEVQAVHDDGQFAPRLILPLSLSYDHRLIDGADAARFLRWIAEALEQPLLLLIDQSEA